MNIAQIAVPEKGREREIATIYHTLQPHEALSPQPIDPLTANEQQDNEVAWSQLVVSRILPLVLPPEDLQNPCLHVLVTEIFSEMIVHRVLCQRLSEPWMLWDGVTKLTRVFSASQHQQPADHSLPTDRLEQFGLLSSEETSFDQKLQHARRGRLDHVAQAILMAMQVCTLGWSLLRSFVAALMHASSMSTSSTQRQREATSLKASVSADAQPKDGPDHAPQLVQPVAGDGYGRPPVVRFEVWACISRLSALNQRMPWLSGFMSLLQWFSLRGPGKVGDTDGILDK